MSDTRDITIDLRVDAFATLAEENGWEWEVKGGPGGVAVLTVNVPLSIARQFAGAAFSYEAPE